MLRSIRLFRSSWSLLLVMAALVFTLAACNESAPTDGGCQYNETTNTCN